MRNDDPLSLIYCTLWSMAESYSGLTKHVKLKNRIRYDKADRDPEKRNLNDADMPELTLLATGLTGNMCNTSNTSMLMCRYSWMIVTGDLRINYRMLPVEWALFIAMHEWRTKLGELLWKDKPYIKSLNMLEVQEGILRPKENQEGPRGWAAVWGIQVQMYFDLNDISQELQNGCAFG